MLQILKELIDRLEMVKNKIKEVRSELANIREEYAGMCCEWIQFETKSLDMFLGNADNDLAGFIAHIDMGDDSVKDYKESIVTGFIDNGTVKKYVRRKTKKDEKETKS